MFVADMFAAGHRHNDTKYRILSAQLCHVNIARAPGVFQGPEAKPGTREAIARIAKFLWLTTTARRARLSALTTEHSNQHLSVTRALVLRRNTSVLSYAMRGTKGNPVQIRCGPATVIGETLSRWHPLEAGCLRKPLSAPRGWEGGRSVAISHEPGSLPSGGSGCTSRNE